MRGNGGWDGTGCTAREESRGIRDVAVVAVVVVLEFVFAWGEGMRAVRGAGFDELIFFRLTDLLYVPGSPSGLG